jgi:hypothetical protein
MTIKAQPQHSAADLARAETIPPGAQSPAGQAILSGRSPLARLLLLEPRRPIVADLTLVGGARRRWGV